MQQCERKSGFAINRTFTNSWHFLAVMRKELKKRNIHNVKVLYSKEEPIKIKEEIIKTENRRKQTPGSISFVPSVAGMIIAGEVIKDIIKN